MARPTNDNKTPVDLTINGVPRGPDGRLSRRHAIRWVLGAVAAASLPTSSGCTSAQPAGGSPPPPTPPPPNTPPQVPVPQEEAAKVPPKVPGQNGYGTDPDLVKWWKPGDAWPLTFDDKQRRAAAALADTILPKDKHGPAATEVGVVEMVDEWVSAPYPQQQADRPVVLKGLAWVDAEAAKRFGGKAFADLDEKQRHAICDDVCNAATTKAEFKEAARFFARFRALCCGAYYGTPQGWQAIGYVGNVALPQFDGPPAEVLRKLGVTQTVK